MKYILTTYRGDKHVKETVSPEALVEKIKEWLADPKATHFTISKPGVKR